MEKFSRGSKRDDDMSIMIDFIDDLIRAICWGWKCGKKQNDF